MGKKYSSNRSVEPERIQKTIHPIWRGIGLLMIILIPIISYAGMQVFLLENARSGWIRIPTDLLAVGSDPLLYVKILVTVVIMFLLYILFMFITFLFNSLIGPSRYGPLDIEPTEFRGPRYKR